MNQNAGWTVSRSIALELGLALYGASGRLPLSDLPQEIASLHLVVSDAWREEWEELVGPLHNTVPIPIVLAWLADVLTEVRYGVATRAMRELDLPMAMARLEAHASTVGATVESGLPPEARFVALWDAMAEAVYGAVGLPELALRMGDEGRSLALLPRLLQGGELHSRFWHLLDRFYYTAYRAWRNERVEAMDALEQRGAYALGAREQAGRAPDMAWLPPQNPLVNKPGLRQAVEDGRMRVLFLVEPLGHYDVLMLLPGLAITAFAEPGQLYRQLGAFAEDLSGRLKAVADPTRLRILRLIRHLDLDNTQIAAYLEVSRPTVSIHARQLREAGLIETRREGRKAMHAVRPEAVRALFKDLERFLDLPGE
jgi:ArsR family transcriptional regulator